MPDTPLPAFPTRPTAADRAGALRHLLRRPELSFLMEAHSGLSAKIAEEAGFSGIWASGLSMATALGLRDNNEASWTQVLDQLEFMADATTVPILVDGDTGYGNFNNVRRLVRKLGERGIAGVCIEDKLFPKTNSFIGDAQPLADIAEFCGRIRAGKDAQGSDAFSIVARVEALISGHSMDVALHRAEAYHAAGADAILIHSKKAVATEILEFLRLWGDRCPVVIVPTMYYATPTEVFRGAGVSTIIWANHLLRASMTAMRDTARQIAADESLANVEHRVVSVRDIFSLMNNDELEEAAKRYLPEVPAPPAAPRAVVLAAARGAGLEQLTADRPKCMIDVRGKPLLQHLVDTLGAAGVSEVTVVRGYRKEAVRLPGIRTADNDLFETTGEAASLAGAADRLGGEAVVVYGDVLFRRYILDALIAAPGDIVLAVDANAERAANKRDLVRADRAYAASDVEEQPARLLAIGEPDEASGEWIGLLRASAEGSRIIRAELDAMRADGTLDAADMPALLARIAAKHPVGVHYVTGHWLDVDTVTDLADARNFS